MYKTETIAGIRIFHLQVPPYQHPLPGAANWANLIQEQRENKMKDKPSLPEEEKSQLQNSDEHHFLS